MGLSGIVCENELFSSETKRRKTEIHDEKRQKNLRVNEKTLKKFLCEGVKNTNLILYVSIVEAMVNKKLERSNYVTKIFQ